MQSLKEIVELTQTSRSSRLSGLGSSRLGILCALLLINSTSSGRAVFTLNCIACDII